ncbi:MAG: hypothetical protein GWN16_10245 [Calditrichae bacterium]|nr:hypothetical protein [Calditrichia bacterium]
MEPFEIVSGMTEIETLAKGQGIKVLTFLIRKYGGKPATWRKKKGRATIRQFGNLYDAELHWFEAHGIGKVNTKIKHKQKL